MPIEKKVIVRVAEGLGNQLFMYANGLALSKNINAALYVDNESGFFKKKNKLRTREYNLDLFKTKIQICNTIDKFNSYPKDFVRKFLKILDFFKSKKLFLCENLDNDNLLFKNQSSLSFNNKIYLEGHFESEKYFSFFEKQLKSSLIVDTNLINKNDRLINSLKSSNSVSIHIRRHRFSEEIGKNTISNVNKSDEFTKSIIQYINRSVNFFRKKIDNPKFFIWSNDFSNLENYFDDSFLFVKNNNLATDFYLFSLSKHFIVGPSTFHWWGAWLNNNSNKICLRPKDIFLNPSNNKDFWPKSWIEI